MADAAPYEVDDVGLVLGPNRALGEPRSLALSAEPPARGSSQGTTTTADDAPEWVMVLPLGRVTDDPDLVEVRDWRPDFRVPDPQMLVDEFNARVESDGPIVVDRNHAELYAWFGRETPAAGWLTELDLRDDGIWGRSGWTPRGAKEVVDREYGYTSSVVMLKWATDSEGRRDYETPPEVSRIVGLSIVNSPGTYTKWLTALKQQPEAYMAGFGLAPFSSAAAEQLGAAAERLRAEGSGPGEIHQTKKAVAGPSASRRLQSGTHGGGSAPAVFTTRPGAAGQAIEAPTMSESSNLTPAARAALERLGLSADASPAEVDAAIARLQSVPSEAVADLSRRVAALTEDANAREAAERERAIEDQLQAALAAGKLTPASVESFRAIGRQNGPEMLAQILGSMPATSLGRRVGAVELDDEPAFATDPEQATFAENWGLTSEQLGAAIAKRDQLPEPLLIDPNQIRYGDAVKVGA